MIDKELTKEKNENNSEGLSDSNPSDDDYDEEYTNKLKQSILKIRNKICRYFNAPETFLNSKIYRNCNKRERVSKT